MGGGPSRERSLRSLNRSKLYTEFSSIRQFMPDFREVKLSIRRNSFRLLSHVMRLIRKRL